MRCESTGQDSITIVTSAGEADARLEPRPPSLVSITGAFVTDTLARYHRALRALLNVGFS
jgi:hypothetical protein